MPEKVVIVTRKTRFEVFQAIIDDVFFILRVRNMQKLAVGND